MKFEDQQNQTEHSALKIAGAGPALSINDIRDVPLNVHRTLQPHDLLPLPKVTIDISGLQPLPAHGIKPGCGDFEPILLSPPHGALPDLSDLQPIPLRPPHGVMPDPGVLDPIACGKPDWTGIFPNGDPSCIGMPDVSHLPQIAVVDLSDIFPQGKPWYIGLPLDNPLAELQLDKIPPSDKPWFR